MFFFNFIRNVCVSEINALFEQYEVKYSANR